VQKFQKKFFKDLFAGPLAKKRGFQPTHAAFGGEPDVRPATSTLF